MKYRYQCLLMALLAGALFWPTQARAQEFTDCPDNEDVCVVQWQNQETGDVIINALRNTIVNDDPRPAGRVYKLLRSGLYYNEDRIENGGFHLRIIGETAEEFGDPENDFGPAVIQMVTKSGGSVDQRMITGQDHMTLKNLWITGQDDAGLTTAYTPIQIDASGKRFVFDNVIFERSNFALVHFTGENNDVWFTNNHFRNFVNTTQQWEGRGIQFSAGADSVVVENNSFFNIGMTVIQSEAKPFNYIRVNHNTMVNIGRTINSGGIWKEAYFTNNLIVNGFWHGEGFADINSPGRDTETAGLFGIGELPAQYGTNLGRRIVFANTAHWRDPKFAAYYADSIRAQPLFNEVTAAFFVDYENINESDNVNVNPELAVYPQLETATLVEKMIQNIRDLRGGITPATSWLWDPGRDPLRFGGDNFVFPLQEDLSYSNEALKTAGTDNLPLGDLNWFPTAKATFEANKAEFVADIESMAQAPAINVVATGQAEAGTVAGDAEVADVEGQTWYTLAPGSAFEWDFNIAEEKEYAIRFTVNMAGRGTSGVDMLLDGTGIFDSRGWGQFVVPSESYTGALNEFVQLRYGQADLHTNSAGRLTLAAGAHKLRIQSSWAENTMWEKVEILDPSNGDAVVLTLTAPMAVSAGSNAGCAEDVPFCASGFKFVNLDDGSITWNMDVPAAGSHMVRVFYSAPSGGTASLELDGTTVVPNITFDAEGTDVLTAEFPIALAGMRSLKLVGNGGVKVDYIQLMSITRSGTATGGNELPEGYGLAQNFPNPFNGSSTRIQFNLGQAGPAKLVVYDVLGRQVVTLVDEVLGAGPHEVAWDGRGANGAQVSSGMYLYRLTTKVGQKTRTMVVVK